MKKQQPTSGFKAIFYNLSFFLLFFSASYAQTVTPWITSGDQSKLLQQQATVSFAANSGNNASTITVTPATTYQTIDGFGWTLTEGSAELINSLAATQQNNLLQELFNPSTGLSSSVVRISIAASDLSSYSYSYNESSGDTNMNNFSLSGPDLTYLVPILKKVLLINPNIKILATPWSAPRWMKSNGNWVGGSLQTTYYAAYAKYFVKYFQAMQAQGINIWAITPQNEPENPYNEPSMTMTSAQQKDFINNHLGPQMSAAGFGGIKIIAFDHNCDNTAYPIDVLNNSGYVDGAAFHLYSGSISAMTTVKNATGKNVYFTEQWVGGPGSFSGDFGWHMQNVVLGAVNNWAKVSMEWNLANNPSYGPRTPGGCTTCLGAITISNSTTYSRNSPYYIIGQISKFVKSGAVRIGSSSSNGSITSSAFKNSDGSTVLVIYNSGASNTIKVVSGANAFNYTVPASSAVSFKWTDGGTAPSGFPGYYNIVSKLSVKGLDVADNSTASGASIQQWELTNGGGSNQRWRFESAGNGQYYIRIKSTGMYLALASASTADGIKVQQKSFTNDNTSKWTVASLGNGYYRIDNVYSSKALDVTDVSTANGALMQVWAYGGGDNQQWQLNQVESTARMGNFANDTDEDVTEETLVKGLSIFPNPSKGVVTLTTMEAGSYTLIGLTGNVIATGKVVSGENTINTQNLASGYYIIRFENEKGGSKTLKLLKE
jgi:glucosylceramidase